VKNKLHSATLWFSTVFAWLPRRRAKSETSETLENTARERVLVILLRGTIIITSLFVLLILVSMFGAGNMYIWPRALAGCFGLLYVVIALWLLRRGWQQAAAAMLVLFYGVTANTAAAVWGIGTPFALLMMVIAIPLAGFLLRARYAGYAAAIQITVLIVLQQVSSPEDHVSLGEAAGFSLLFAVLGLVTWLFGGQIEASLRRAWRAEHELQQEKDQLEIRLRERTESLRTLQLQEMKQLYRFAELGQMSTALLHDLANRLTVLTLDIEALGGHGRTEAVERAKQSISHLDELVGQVSAQLHEQRPKEQFSVAKSIEQVLTDIRAWRSSGVHIVVEQQGDVDQLRLIGDATRFGQVLTIVLGNAVDAAKASGSHAEVTIELRGDAKQVEVFVKDSGPGIPTAARRKLFTPFYTTKTEGMGIGLFIARQMIETHFHGTVTLERASEPTTFRLHVPKEGEGHGTKQSRRNANGRSAAT